MRVLKWAVLGAQRYDLQTLEVIDKVTTMWTQELASCT